MADDPQRTENEQQLAAILTTILLEYEAAALEFADVAWGFSGPPASFWESMRADLINTLRPHVQPIQFAAGLRMSVGLGVVVDPLALSASVVRSTDQQIIKLADQLVSDLKNRVESQVTETWAASASLAAIVAGVIANINTTRLAVGVSTEAITAGEMVAARIVGDQLTLQTVTDQLPGAAVRSLFENIDTWLDLLTVEADLTTLAASEAELREVLMDYMDRVKDFSKLSARAQATIIHTAEQVLLERGHLPTTDEVVARVMKVEPSLAALLKDVAPKARLHPVAYWQVQTKGAKRELAMISDVVPTPTWDFMTEPVWRFIPVSGIPDEKVCPVCEPLHERPLYDLPDDFQGGPPAHPNCRCFLKWTLEAIS